MSTSRRKFLKAGILTALVAAVLPRHVRGQDPDDPLANFSKATFNAYLNSIFQLQTVTGTVEVTLRQVNDMPAPTGGECFGLLFRGGSTALRQNTYTLVHAALGTFQLFLVPVGTDENGAQGYLATINRLPLA